LLVTGASLAAPNRWRFSHHGLAVTRRSPLALLNRCLPNGLVARTEVQIGFVLVVRTAPKLDVLEARFSAITVRLYMVELEEASRAAALAIGAREGATSAIPFPHGPPHRGRKTARRRPCRPSG